MVNYEDYDDDNDDDNDDDVDDDNNNNSEITWKVAVSPY